MRNLLFISLFLALSAAAFAQPTITKNDMPSAGYYPRFSIGDSMFSIDLSQTGNNHTWDYTAMQPIAQRVDTFLSPNSVPFSYKLVFTSATVAQRQLNDSLALGSFTFTDAFNFYKATTNAYINQGFGAMSDLAPIPLSQVYAPADTIYRLPLTNTSAPDTGYARSVVNIPTLLYWEHEQDRYTAVDGWGTLNTPYGSFSALRVRSEVVSTDTISVSTFGGFRIPGISQITYSWLASGRKVPVMQVNASNLLGTEVATSVEYLDTLRSGVITIGVDKPVAQTLLIAPNPVRESAQITLPAPLHGATMTVFAADGRQLFSLPFADGQLIVSSLAAGIYQVEVLTADGQRHTGKIVVERQ